VHGYDLKTLTSISTQSHRHLFVSGADEKEIRVFDAPMNAIKFLNATKNIGKVVTEDGLDRVERAYIPSLGLSNKASAADGADEDIEGVVEEDDAIHLPLERDLGAVSLWPEVGKLYGHNTELYCLTSTLTAKSGPPVDGPFATENLVASSAKARYVDDASIRIWDVGSNKCVQVLVGGHKSTVATLAFSPDGTYLASSGKDRRLCIWTRTPASAGGPFTLATEVDSAHKRIVWSVHFCPHDPTMLATGGRDGHVKIWRLTVSASTVSCSVIGTFEATSRSGKKAEPVTAVSFAPIKCAGDDPLLAIGLETGLIELWGIRQGECKFVNAIEPSSCHFSTITKLCWKPVRNDKEQKLILASSSMDHGVRLFTVNVR
jgi:elongator complex protein 2